jgi:hypothetical protein
MPRRRKALMPDAPLAPVPAEILDQFVRQGPISPEELDAAVRRFKNAFRRHVRKMLWRMDAAGAVDPRTRPPLLGKPHRTRFPTAPTRVVLFREKEDSETTALTRLTHEIPDTPRQSGSPL